MTRDYYSLLQRAVAASNSDTEQARRTLYDRARNAILAADISPAERQAEGSALEGAIERIEAEQQQPRRLGRRLSRGPIKAAKDESASVLQSPRAWLVICTVGAALLVAGLLLYVPWTRTVATPSGPGKQIAGAPPRLDARRSSDADRSYIFNRQLAYYRTVHPTGTVLIAKAQRFLYLVVSDVSAIRYTVGVGRECANVSGLLLVSAKEQWPDPAQQASDPRQPGSRFGVRSLALSDSGHRIHGKNAVTIAGEDGCFPLINEDIVHLYNRVAVGTRVVIN